MGARDIIGWYGGAVALGYFFAFVIILIFRRWAPVGATRQFWADLSKDIHGLLFGDEALFWRHYSSVIRRSSNYIGRQLLGVFLAFAPLVVAFFVIGPLIFSAWDRDAPLTVIPTDAGKVITSGSQSPAEGGVSTTLILRNGYRLRLSSEPGSQVLCPPGSFGCLVLQGFGFTAHIVDQALSGTTDLLIVRTAHNDWNPLWPYLADPEFLFFMSLSLFSFLLFFRQSKRADSTTSNYTIGLSDYVFTRLAIGNARVMTSLGNWETRIYAKRLARITVDEPIFIAGLARSGTTILLEKLASVTGIVTHRYRDFPFIMTPIFWNRFLRIFGARQNPVERPHKDKIKITRDSPDAFEEPIWQYYFPLLHDTSRIHRLDSETNEIEFERFYRQHIQKILVLRKGSRYLSKGNYNLPRIEYISEIFPDAQFLIPIRHPLTHVASLVRQHKLFTKYATADSTIPDYLRAVGHYEFGPQRLPICLTASSAHDIESAWQKGNDLLGYAIQWADVYGFIADLYGENEELRKRIRIVRFEDLCGRPEEELQEVLNFIGLAKFASAKELAQGIEAPSHSCCYPPGELEACWQVVKHVANQYGYTDDPESLLDFSGLPEPQKRCHAGSVLDRDNIHDLS